jgi:hypothetical protein
MFCDWDISLNGGTDLGNEDVPNKLGYERNTIPKGFWAGIELLTNGPFIHYAIDNDGSVSPGTGGISIYDGYTDAEKYQTLSTGRATSHLNVGGGDCSDVVSTGPFTLAPGDSVITAFALLVGDTLDDLQTSAVNAKKKYQGLFTDVSEHINKISGFNVSVMPNPVKQTATFQVNLTKAAVTELNLYDITGQKVAVLLNENMTVGTHEFSRNLGGLRPGVYFYNLESGTERATGRLVIIQ